MGAFAKPALKTFADDRSLAFRHFPQGFISVALGHG
jgi:hypothetical protein